VRRLVRGFAVIALLAAFSLPSAASAEPLNDIFATANRAYFAGDFAAAEDGY
jgi:hypothetical protein